MIKNNLYKFVKNKKITIIIALVLLGLTVWLLFSGIILDKIDENKFITLNNKMDNLYEKIENSSSSENWIYKPVCSANRTGWMKTGDYNCVTSISTRKQVSSADELDSLFKDYFNLIDKDDDLESISDLVKKPETDFGRSFVVSGASKDYKEIKSSVECEYSIKLYQYDESVDSLHDSYGAPIVGSRGNAFVSLRCSDTARNNWYPLSDTADLIIP